MTRTLRYSRLAAVILLAALFAIPGAAHAAGVTEYQLQYAPNADQSLLIVTAVADPQLPLPVTIAVPVPAGATVLWAGEVLGGAPANDPTRETTVESVGDMDVYTLTLEQAYTAQIELQLPAAAASGSRFDAKLTWTNPGDEVPVRASVIMPAGAGDVKLSPAVSGQTNTNDLGETLHPLTGGRLAEGAAMVIEASWTIGGGGQAGSTSATLPVLLGLLVLAVAALVIVAVRERTRARRAAAEADDL